jgi:NADH dehydrogenase (ubiquinone) Fe-S protein 6
MQLALPNVHRSDAAVRVAQVPVVEVAAEVAMCDGGGGSTGHPVEYIKLELREGHAAVPCKYCGVRYRRAGGHH